MIEDFFIENNIKDLTKEEAYLLALSEKDSVYNKLKTEGYNILSAEQQSLTLSSEGMSLWYYYHDLDWLSNILNGNEIVDFDRTELHNKLKIILTKEGLI